MWKKREQKDPYHMTEQDIIREKVKRKQRQEERRERFEGILEVIFEWIASILESIFS